MGVILGCEWASVFFIFVRKYLKCEVTPLLMHWSYVFLALTHRYDDVTYSTVMTKVYAIDQTFNWQ